MATQTEESYVDELVRLVVKSSLGNIKVEYIPVHKRHCSRHSPVLAHYFSIDEKKDFKILDSTPSTVRLLVNWLYMQDVNLDVHQGKACGQKTFDTRQLSQAETYAKAKACKDEIDMLVNAWILAGELKICKLQNNIMVKLLVVARTCPTMFAPFYTRIYAKTQAGSPLREFVVRLAAWTEDYHEYESRPHLFPHAMLLDLMRVYCQATPRNVAAARRHQIQRELMDFIVREDQVDPDAGKEIPLAEMLKKVPAPELSLEAVGWGFPEPVRVELDELPSVDWRLEEKRAIEKRVAENDRLSFDLRYKGLPDIVTKLRSLQFDSRNLDEEAFKAHANLEVNPAVSPTPPKPVWENSDSGVCEVVEPKTLADWDSGDNWVTFSGPMTHGKRGDDGRDGSNDNLNNAEVYSEEVSPRSFSAASSTPSPTPSPKWDTNVDAAWVAGNTSAVRKLPRVVSKRKVGGVKVDEMIGDLLGLSDDEKLDEVVVVPCECVLVCICGRG